MKRLALLILITTLNSTFLYSQKRKIFADSIRFCINNREYKKDTSRTGNCWDIHCYYNIKDALKSPEKVQGLDLRSQGLKKFPIEILKFKNLMSLDLGADLKVLSDSTIRYFDSIYVYKPRRKYRTDFDILFESTHPIKPNKIRSIPPEIKELTNLKLLILYNTKLSKRDIKKLRILLPNCIIRSKYDDYFYPWLVD